MPRSTSDDSTSGGNANIGFDDMTDTDVDKLTWIDNNAHRVAVRGAVAAAALGDATYRAGRSGADIVAYGGIDYTAADGTGTLFQLTVRDDRRSEGIGTALIANLIDDAVARGCHRILLHVEDDNPRARALYERLGFHPCGTTIETWVEEDSDGHQHPHSAHCTVMAYELTTATSTDAEARQGSAAPATAAG